MKHLQKYGCCCLNENQLIFYQNILDSKDSYTYQVTKEITNLKIDFNNNAELDDCDCDGCGNGNPWVSAHISYANNTQSTKNVSRIKDIG